MSPRKSRKPPELEPFPLLRMVGKVKLKGRLILIFPGTWSASAGQRSNREGMV